MSIELIVDLTSIQGCISRSNNNFETSLFFFALSHPIAGGGCLKYDTKATICALLILVVRRRIILVAGFSQKKQERSNARDRKIGKWETGETQSYFFSWFENEYFYVIIRLRLFF